MQNVHQLSEFFGKVFDELWDDINWSNPLFAYAELIILFNEKIAAIFNNSREATKYLIQFMVKNFMALTTDLERDETNVFMTRLRRE